MILKFGIDLAAMSGLSGDSLAFDVTPSKINVPKGGGRINEVRKSVVIF